MSKTIRRGLVRRIGGADFPCPNVKLAVTFLSSSGSGVCRHIIRPPSHPFFICRDGQSVRVKVLVIQSCPTLFDPLTIYSPPDSSVHGILQARILEWLPFPSPGDLPNPGIKLRFPALQADSLLSGSPGKPRDCQNLHSNLTPAGRWICSDSGQNPLPGGRTSNGLLWPEEGCYSVPSVSFNNHRKMNFSPDDFFF